MKKTITANISGIVFHIEADAYDKLNSYINTIRTYFRNTEEVDEIISDIEARIAELFREMLKDNREVVTIQDVDRVIETMGEPEQFAGPEEEYSNSARDYNRTSFRKKLYRDPDDKVLGGVCSGIGHYFGLDSIWIRAIFLIAFFAFGVGFIPYIILWIIMPLAKTASEKLEMKGHAVTVDSIGRTIKDEYNHFKKKVDTGKFRSTTDKIEEFFAFLFGIIVYIFKFLLKLVALLVIIATVSMLFFISTGFFIGPDNFNLEINNVDYVLQSELIGLILDSNFLHYSVIISLILLVSVPLLALLYAAIKLFFNFRSKNRIIGLSLAILWGFSILILIASAIVIVDKFSSSEAETNLVVLENFESDTLYLSSHLPTELEGVQFDGDADNVPIFIEGERVYMKGFSVDVYPSNTEDFKLKIKKKTFGDNDKNASYKLKNISYSYTISDSSLSINEYINFPKKDGFRNQEMQISIAVPLNKVIYFTQSSKKIIYDVENVSDTWDHEMIGHYWKMTGNGLECLDCEWINADHAEMETDSTEVKLVE